MISVDALMERRLPDGWDWKTMGDIADVVSGGTPKTSDASNFDRGEIPWLTPSDLSGYTQKYVSHGARLLTQKGLQSCSAKLIPSGSVLFTSRAPIGYVAIASNPIATNQGFKNFVLRGEVLPEYVYWWLKGSKQLAESLASGTTFLEISGSNAKKLPIPVAPIAKQREIVAELEKQFSRLDEAVANLQRVKTNLKRYKASVLKAAVEGRLVETEASLARREGRTFETGEQLLQRVLVNRKKNGKAKPNFAPSSLANSLLSRDIPKGWAWTTTGQLCDCIVPNRDKPKTFTGDIPWLTLPDFDDSEIAVTGSRSGLGFTESEVQLYSAKVIPVDSVVMSCVGRFGISAVLTRKSVINQQLHAFLPNEGVLPRYLAYVLRTRQQEMIARSTATTIAYLNKDNCNSITVPLPPLSEQTRIVAEVDRHLSILREVETEVDANLKRAQALRQATLRKAFSPSV